MKDFCFHAATEAQIIAALDAAGLAVAGMDSIKRPVGSYCYAGRIVDVPGEYTMGPDGLMTTTREATFLPGVYAAYRATDDQAAAIRAVSLPEGVSLTDPPAGLPLFGGEWLTGLDLGLAKSSARTDIDAEAERRRNLVLTPGSGQMAAYQAKEAQAIALLQDPLPNEDKYPDIYNEVGITANTAHDVATAILAAAEAWRMYGRAIERARLTGKKAVGGAGDLAGVVAARDGVEWPEV